MSGGLEQGAIATIKYNRSLLKQNKLRYSDVKNQYIGIGNQSALNTQSTLSPSEKAAGRERARIYLQKRKLCVLVVFMLLIHQQRLEKKLQKYWRNKLRTNLYNVWVSLKSKRFFMIINFNNYSIIGLKSN